LAIWEKSTYDAIRTAGNNNIILLEAGPGGGVPGETGIAGGMTPSVFAAMTNVVWDQHYYPWIVPGVTDIGVIESSITRLVQADQTITSADGTIPVLIAEYGPSTTGASPDGNGMAVVQAVNASGVIAGRAAWNWNSQDCCNNLTSGGSVTNPYGAFVRTALAGGAASGGGATSAVAAAQNCAASATPLSATAANIAAVTQALTGTAQPGATPVALSVDSSVVPPAAAPSSAQSSSTSSPAPPPTPQAEAAANVQQGEAIGAAANAPQVDQQVQAQIAQAQAAIAAANGTGGSK
jgi:hypothetical protein